MELQYYIKVDVVDFEIKRSGGYSLRGRRRRGGKGKKTAHEAREREGR